jgi:metal-responsive CopG/Arc/MetJ family transcriptional regulator
MKTMNVTINDQVFAKFAEIQKEGGFSNQSECLEFVIEQVTKQKKEEKQHVGET